MDHKTKVLVNMTNIMVLDMDSLKVDTIQVMGKLTILQSKEYLKNIENKGKFVSKENIINEYTVDTLELLKIVD